MNFIELMQFHVNAIQNNVVCSPIEFCITLSSTVSSYSCPFYGSYETMKTKETLYQADCLFNFFSLNCYSRVIYQFILFSLFYTHLVITFVFYLLLKKYTHISYQICNMTVIIPFWHNLPQTYPSISCLMPLNIM